MAHIEDVLLWMLTMTGKPYVFGAEIDADDPDPQAADCSELVEYAARRAGVVPSVPDGAYNQWRSTIRHGTQLPVGIAEDTRGALLFFGDGTGVGREAITHVAVSLGDGTTVEARGTRWGIGSFSVHGRGWDFAGQFPGVDYSPRQPLPLEADMTGDEAAELKGALEAATEARDNVRKIVGQVDALSKKVDNLSAGGGQVDVDKLAEAVAAKIAKRLEA